MDIRRTELVSSVWNHTTATSFADDREFVRPGAGLGGSGGSSLLDGLAWMVRADGSGGEDVYSYVQNWRGDVVAMVDEQARLEPVAHHSDQMGRRQTRAGTGKVIEPATVFASERSNGRGGIRTPVGIIQQIYSLPRLAASVHALSPDANVGPES